MANPQVRRRPEPVGDSASETESERSLEGGEDEATRVRRARLERLEGRDPPPRTRDSLTERDSTTMPTVTGSLKSSRSRRHHHGGEREHTHRRRRESAVREEEESFVYGPPKKRVEVTVRETPRRLGREGESEESGSDHVRRERSGRERPKDRKVRVVYVTKEEMKNMPLKERRPRTGRKSSDRSRTPEEVVHRSRAQHSRHTSMPEVVASPPKR